VKHVTLGELAGILGCAAPAEADLPIAGIGPLDEAGPNELSYVSSDAYLRQLRGTRAAAVIVQTGVKLPRENTRPVLLVEDAELAVAKVLAYFAPPVPAPPPGIHASAVIDPTAELGEGVAVGPHVVIGARCHIGRASVLYPGVVLGDDVTIGEACRFYPKVVIRERITVGSRVIIHAGSVLGTDGFGYRWDGRQHAKVPQIGTVIIEDDVEIGSCVCIDRAKFSSTRIGIGTKIDNLVQIAHNVQIGPHCIIVGQAGLAGSARLGTGVVLGGQAAVRDHVTLGEGAMAAACSAIVSDVEPRTIVSGMPALPHRQSLREQAALRHLPALRDQVRKLQDELEELKKRMDGMA
jgi:UDP-3-O-[3-hydroxymyristoyl] glucosamine N-acyltransferase